MLGTILLHFHLFFFEKDFNFFFFLSKRYKLLFFLFFQNKIMLVLKIFKQYFFDFLKYLAPNIQNSIFFHFKLFLLRFCSMPHCLTLSIIQKTLKL